MRACAGMCRHGGLFIAHSSGWAATDSPSTLAHTGVDFTKFLMENVLGIDANGLMGRAIGAGMSVAPSSASDVVMLLTTPHVYVGKKAASTLMSACTSSFAVYASLGVGAKLLYSFYGNQISTTILNRLWMPGVADGGGAMHAKAEASRHLNPNNNPHLATMISSDAQKMLAALSSNGLGASMLTLALLLSYLHTMGAYEMRKQTITRRAKEQSDSMQPVAKAHAGNQEEGGNDSLVQYEESKRHIESHMQSMNRDMRVLLHNLIHITSSTTPPTKAEGGSAPDHPHANLLTKPASPPPAPSPDANQTDDSLLMLVIHQIYGAQPFYQGTGAYLSRPGDINVVRVAFNTLLGLVMQLDALFMAGTARGDRVKVAARLVSLLGYWEALMHLLRLHGWAPLYLAVRQLLALLTPMARRHARRRRR